MSKICAIVLLFLSCLASAAEDRSLLLVELPAPDDAIHELSTSIDVHGRYGSFALAHGDADDLRALVKAGAAVHALGPWPAGHDLYVSPADALRAPGARVLGEFAGVEIVAVAEAAAPLGTADVDRADARLVPREPRKPRAPFRVPPELAATMDSGELDPRIVSALAQMSEANILATTTHLSSYSTRLAGSAGFAQAKDWLMAELATIPGLTVSEFPVPGFGANVVAELTGGATPDEVVILGAHLDSRNLVGALSLAPGADNNAAGVAATLEAARVLAPVGFSKTIRFVFFTANAFWFEGSKAYALQLEAEGVTGVAMMNLDQLAYTASGANSKAVMFPVGVDAKLTDFCMDVADDYVPDLTLQLVFGSVFPLTDAYIMDDFMPSATYRADEEKSPYYNTAFDVVGTGANDFPQVLKLARAATATAALLAFPGDIGLLHTPLANTDDASGPYPVEVTALPLDGSPVTDVLVHWRRDFDDWQVAELMPGLVPDQWLGSIPGTTNGTITYWIEAANANGETERFPVGELLETYDLSFTVSGIEGEIFWDFDGPDDEGWTHGAMSPPDQWERGTPLGNVGDPSGAFSGDNVWGTNLAGAYASDADMWLQPPLIDCSEMSDIRLEFTHATSVHTQSDDFAIVRVNGQLAFSMFQWANPDWQTEVIDISEQAAGVVDTKIRFRLRSGASQQFGGWNIDDVRIISVNPGEVDPLVADRLYLSVSEGGAASFDLDAGASFGGEDYVMLMGFTGSQPGTSLGAVTVPVNFDVLSQLGLSLLGTPALPGWAGQLDLDGRSAANLTSPPLDLPELVGVELTFAFATVKPSSFASNPVALTFLP